MNRQQRRFQAAMARQKKPLSYVLSNKGSFPGQPEFGLKTIIPTSMWKLKDGKKAKRVA